MKVLDGDERKVALEMMTYRAVELHKSQNRGALPTKQWMNLVVFKMAKELLKTGTDVRLPYFWFTDGPEVVWEDFTDKLVFADGTPVRSPE